MQRLIIQFAFLFIFTLNKNSIMSLGGIISKPLRLLYPDNFSESFPQAA